MALKIKCLSDALRIRKIEERIASEYPKGKFRCPTHLSIGQELNASMVCAFLGNEDLAISTHRSHAHYLAKGGDLRSFIAELFGLPSGCSKGYGGSMHLQDVSRGFMGSIAIVGSSIPIGVGLGIGLRMKKPETISVVFLGEAATEQGVFLESLNIAALWNSPTVFVCEDNLYSVYTPPKSRVTELRSLQSLVESQGVKYYECTRSDFDQNFLTIEGAIKETRMSMKPSFILIPSYRFLEHCGPNDDSGLGYRTKEEVEYFRSIDLLEATSSKLISNETLVKFLASCELEISQVFQDCELEYNSLKTTHS